MLHSFAGADGVQLLYSPAGLLQLAATQCGLDLPHDPATIVALEHLCAAFEAGRPNQTSFGKLHAQAILLAALGKRLRLSSYLRRFPEIRAVQLPSPIFVVAPFRSGTTFLHRLLAQDPQSRWPRVWEMAYPPPAEPDFRGAAGYFLGDARIAMAAAALRTLQRASPKLSRLHPMATGLAEECLGLLETSLMSHSFIFYADVPSYCGWLDGCGAAAWRSAYAIYADQLRLLHWWYPGRRWLLKSPVHLWNLEALLGAIPNAHVVQLHRDPVAVTESFCRLLSAHRDMVCRTTRPAAIGEQALGYLRSALGRAVAARRGRDASRFIDVEFNAMLRDPIACARMIYRRVGEDLTPQAETAMAEWLAQNAPGPPGADTDLESFSLKSGDVREAFAAYDALCAAEG